MSENCKACNGGRDIGICNTCDSTGRVPNMSRGLPCKCGHNKFWHNNGNEKDGHCSRCKCKSFNRDQKKIDTNFEFYCEEIDEDQFEMVLIQRYHRQCFTIHKKHLKIVLQELHNVTLVQEQNSLDEVQS